MPVICLFVYTCKREQCKHLPAHGVTRGPRCARWSCFRWPRRAVWQAVCVCVCVCVCVLRCGCWSSPALCLCQLDTSCQCLSTVSELGESAGTLLLSERWKEKKLCVCVFSCISVPQGQLWAVCLEKGQLTCPQASSGLLSIWGATHLLVNINHWLFAAICFYDIAMTWPVCTCWFPSSIHMILNDTSY